MFIHMHTLLKVQNEIRKRPSDIFERFRIQPCDSILGLPEQYNRMFLTKTQRDLASDHHTKNHAEKFRKNSSDPKETPVIRGVPGAQRETMEFPSSLAWDSQIAQVYSAEKV